MYYFITIACKIQVKFMTNGNMVFLAFYYDCQIMLNYPFLETAKKSGHRLAVPCGANGEIRTRDLLITNQLLYR
jgi:hypothetical protein